jgi:hypothetical protein
MAVLAGNPALTEQRPKKRAMSLPIREQRMFDTSAWTIAPTGSPYQALSTQRIVGMVLIILPLNTAIRRSIGVVHKPK